MRQSNCLRQRSKSQLRAANMTIGRLPTVPRYSGTHGSSSVSPFLSMSPIHGQPYPHRQGVGKMRDPVTRITPDMSDPIIGWSFSATHSRMALSAAFRSSRVPPHQYVMSCSTQQDCQSESGHKLQPSVLNLRSGTYCSPPRRSVHRSVASLGRSSGKRASGSLGEMLPHPALDKAIATIVTTSDVDGIVMLVAGRFRRGLRIFERISHVESI